MRFAQAIVLAILSTGASAMVRWSYQQPVHNGNPNVGQVQRPGVVYAPVENSSVERVRGRESNRIIVRAHLPVLADALFNSIKSG